MSPPPESQYNLLRRIPSMQAPKFTINLRLPHPAATAGAAVRAAATLVGRRHELNGTHSDILDRLDGLLGSRPNRLIQRTPAIRTVASMGRNTTQGNSNTSKNTHLQDSFLFQRQDRTRYHMPFRPWAEASPVRLMPDPGVQVLQLGELPYPTPSKRPMQPQTWPVMLLAAM
jgi:hypothetical protein